MVICSWKVKGLSERGKLLWQVLPAAIMWTVWKSRNEVVFNDANLNVEDIIVKVKLQMHFWVAKNGAFKGELNR
ncbi:hypothetical protein BVC80_8883g7 [Macleaya cordata]|uniref:Uncharacterized protein n=1 Tax=Macleaya cordata TaxID=56857 RepID=A0A200Q793_MACCD|nr:hypothetical protein BVC80_8883g7 [Macleaya cordata]